MTTIATEQVIKIEQIPGKTAIIYTALGIKEIIRLGVLSEKDINSLPMSKKARIYWETISNTHNSRKA